MKRLLALASTVAAFTALFAACGGDVTAFGDSSNTGGSDGTGGTGGTSSSSSDGSGGDMVTSSVGVGGDGAGGMGTSAVSSSASGGGTITCGDMTCDAATQECCATQGGASCIAIGDPCMGATLSCSSAANCPGNEVCCLAFQMGQAPTAECAPMCQGGGPGGPIQLCETAAECPNNEPCEEAFGGFFVCGGGFP